MKRNKNNAGDTGIFPDEGPLLPEVGKRLRLSKEQREKRLEEIQEKYGVSRDVAERMLEESLE